MFTFRLPLACICFAMMSVVASAEDAPLYRVPLKDIEGHETSLKAYAGKTLLIVNVASECGFTPQYEGLEALFRKYRDRGFIVLGFPCNDFGQQEPGDNKEIKRFCSAKFDVTFPLFDKLHTIGPDQHPLYLALTGPASHFPGPVTWNFNKFLVAPDGTPVARFDSAIEPNAPELVHAIETSLPKK